MSSLSESYGEPDLLRKIAILSNEEQNNYIERATPDEIIDIFEKTVKSPSLTNPGNMLFIRELALEKLQKLRNNKSLDHDQVKVIVNICKSALPFVEKSIDTYLERGILQLLTSEINQQNVYEMTRFALEQKSKPILDKCFKVFEEMTAIRPECENFGPLTFTYDKENLEREFSQLSDVLSSLKTSLGSGFIKVCIDADMQEQLGYEELLSFFKEHSEMIHSLKLTNFNGLGVNAQLNTLFTHCSHLTTLDFNKCSISSQSAIHLSLLKKLRNLSFRYCHSLTTPPDLSSLTKLKQLSFYACIRIKNPPKLKGLSQLESLTLSATQIENPPNLKGLVNLKFLNLSTCLNLKSYPDLSQSPKLEDLKLDGCFQVQEEEKKNSFIHFMTVNPELALKHLWQFKIKDTRSLESKILKTDSKFYFENIDKFKPPNLEFRKSLINDLIKKNPAKAIEYIWHLGVGNPIAINDKEAFIDAVETYCLQQNPNKALRLAIDIDDVALAEKAIGAKASINGGSEWGIPLMRACKHGSANMVNFLLDHQADPKVIAGTHDHQTPLSEAILRGDTMSECLNRLKEKDDGFTDEVMALKLLAHKFSAVVTYKVDGKEFQGDGFRPRYIVDDYVNKNTFFYEELQREILVGNGAILDAFSKDIRALMTPLLEDTKQRQKLVNAIKLAFSTLKQSLDNEAIDLDANDGALKKEMLKTLKEGQPVVCYSITRAKSEGNKGVGLHAWGLIVTKDPDSDQYLLHRCNRGYGSKNNGGILVDKFSEKDMLQIVGKYQNLSNWKISSEENSEDYYNETEASFLHSTHITQKLQEAGNCCYYSFQSIELALLNELLKPITGDTDSIKLAREIKNIRTNQMRVKELKHYLDTHQPGSKYPVNWDVLRHIYTKSEEKQKLHRYKELILDYALRVVNAENQQDLDVFFTHLGDSKDKEIQNYQTLRTTESDEMRAVAIIELVKCNSRLLDELRDFIPFKKEDIQSSPDLTVN